MLKITELCDGKKRKAVAQDDLPGAGAPWLKPIGVLLFQVSLPFSGL